MPKNSLQVREEPPIVFTDGVNQGLFSWPSGTTFIQFSPANGDLPHISDVCDLGSGVRTNIYEWRAYSFLARDVNVGIYLSTSDGTYYDGGMVGSDAYSTKLATYGKAALVNLQPVGSLRRINKGSTIPNISSGRVKINSRYFSIIWYADAGLVYMDSGLHYFMLTPVPTEEQDATLVPFIPMYDFSDCNNSEYLSGV